MAPFVCFVSLISNQTPTMLNDTPLVQQHFHIIILNDSTSRGQWLICNVYTLVRLISVRCSGKHLEGEGSRDIKEMSVQGLTPLITVPLECSVRL